MEATEQANIEAELPTHKKKCHIEAKDRSHLEIKHRSYIDARHRSQCAGKPKGHMEARDRSHLERNAKDKNHEDQT